MWLIFKIKNIKNFLEIKKNLFKLIKVKPTFYWPKICTHIKKGEKVFQKNHYILGNYILVHDTSFNDQSILNKVKYLKGVEYIVKGFKFNQLEIAEFVKRCKNNEDEQGYLSQNFFNIKIGKELKFSSGPFMNFISELIKEQKNKLQVLVGKYTISINKKRDCILTAA